MERSIGRGAGAVGVAGAGLNVRVPRLPWLPPPPTRASANADASAIVTTRHALIKLLNRKQYFIFCNIVASFWKNRLRKYSSQYDSVSVSIFKAPDDGMV